MFGWLTSSFFPCWVAIVECCVKENPQHSPKKKALQLFMINLKGRTGWPKHAREKKWHNKSQKRHFSPKTFLNVLELMTLENFDLEN